MFASLEPLTHRSSHSSAFRNFLFMSLPPLEVSPVNIQRIAKNETLLPNAVQVEIWNMLMAKAVAKWSRDNGVHGMLFDSHMALTLILDNADKYGIRNTTGYCPHYDAPDIATQYESYGCLPIEQYFWYSMSKRTLYEVETTLTMYRFRTSHVPHSSSTCRHGRAISGREQRLVTDDGISFRPWGSVPARAWKTLKGEG